MTESNNLNILAWYVDAIMQKHGTYCNVTIKPKFCRETNKYVSGTDIQTYISGLPAGYLCHITHDSYEDAEARLREYFNGGPLELYEELRREKIADIKNEMEYLQEQLNELREG